MTAPTLSVERLADAPDLLQAVKVIADAFEQADLFFGHGTDNALDEAMWLAAHALEIRYSQPDWQALFEHALQGPVDQSLAQQLVLVAQARITERKPMSYLLGEAWFAGLRFEVNESVLVPRSPIAEMIASGFAPWIDAEQPLNVLDLCTGSGCIGIASAIYYPHWTIDASDVSSAALDVAQQNVSSYDVGERVTLIEADLFDGPFRADYDLIVTNPPYVDAEEMTDRPAEYRAEPALGLAAGNDGLSLARVILAQAAEHLTEDGVLVCEVGASDRALQAAFPEVPFTWLEFSDQSVGVFVIDKPTLQEHAGVLSQLEGNLE
ncbi:MAG: 50S ribosomal protein L3 N(5)-glutamine methyltransferase [Woeseiaceae bacterium]